MRVNARVHVHAIQANNQRQPGTGEARFDHADRRDAQCRAAGLGSKTSTKPGAIRLAASLEKLAQHEGRTARMRWVYGLTRPKTPSAVNGQPGTYRSDYDEREGTWFWHHGDGERRGRDREKYRLYRRRRPISYPQPPVWCSLCSLWCRFPEHCWMRQIM